MDRSFRFAIGKWMKIPAFVRILNVYEASAPGKEREEKGR